MIWLSLRMFAQLFSQTSAAVKGPIDVATGAITLEKTRLELQALKKEIEESRRLIKPADFEDIKMFVPAVQRIHEQIKLQEEKRRRADFIKSMSIIILLIGFVVSSVKIPDKTWPVPTGIALLTLSSILVLGITLCRKLFKNQTESLKQFAF